MCVSLDLLRGERVIHPERRKQTDGRTMTVDKLLGLGEE
jgi:hypothetical protein